MTDAGKALTDPDPSTGDSLADASGVASPPAAARERYELLEEIARGGMGLVFRARDSVLRREVAVKVLHERFEPGSPTARRFIDEARITGQLQHPGVPAVHDLGTLPDGRPFLAMKLIKGRTLADLIEGGGPIDLVAVFEQVCQAVGYAHAHEVIHRDLKPANVMVGSYGEVQVMDWGLAKVLASGGRQPPVADPQRTTAEATEIQTQRGADEATRAGSVLGTPAYMPPEQAIGAIDQVDRGSDVFGLGALLCAMLTGKPPYTGGDSEAVRQLAARARLDDAFARLDASGAEPGLVTLCKRCLSAEKADRPADAGEVAREVTRLRAAAEERARHAELESVWAEGELLRINAEARDQRKRRAQLALATAVGLMLLGGGASAWHWDRQATQRQSENDQRGREEQARRERNEEALAELLGRCEDALRAGDAGAAAAALLPAERRLAEDGGDGVRERARRCRADLALLRELTAIDTFRWMSVVNTYPEANALAEWWRSALDGYGLTPGKAGAGEAAARVAGSPLRERLLMALDLWLLAEPGAAAREVVRAADADPYREAMRDAVAAGDKARQAELAGRPESLVQPPRFAVVLGRNRVVAAGRRRAILEAALWSRPRDLALLMELGLSYPSKQRGGAEERARWYQAAVAAHPLNVAAHYRLGFALLDKGDLEGAVACFREAVRLDPNYTWTHVSLGIALRDKGDVDGVIACYREAHRLDPNNVWFHVFLGIALRDKGDVDGAVASFTEAIRLDPKNAIAHMWRGRALKDKGDLDGALACYREALRLDPKDATAASNLRKVEALRRVLPRLADVLAGRAAPKSPAEGCDFARLCGQPFKKLYATAARLYEKAFAGDAALANDLTAHHRYNAACVAAMAARGDGVDAPGDPAERATLRAKALAWLRADLTLHRKQATSADPAQRQAAAEMLTDWQRDGDLAGLRPGQARIGMPAAERGDWDALWADVRATLAEAREPRGDPGGR